MGKLIKQNGVKLFLGIIILIQFFVLIRNSIELTAVKKQNVYLQTRASVLPTATEVFNLRSSCEVLGQKILDNNIIGGALSQSVVSYYNPVTNRCYAQLTVQSANLSGDDFSNYLFDGQTKEILASATQQKGKKEYGNIFSGPVRQTVSDSSETTFQSTNDYINEVMHDEWKQ